MSGWIDAHNHLQDRKLEGSQGIIEGMRRGGVVRCVANATCQHDWSRLEALAARHPDLVLPAFGIHPWWAHTAAEGWQQQLTVILERHPLASVGEAGLDRWVGEPAIEIQRPVFEQQLRIARELDRPLTIHCLRAWGELLEAFEHQPPPRRFLMHAYAGSLELAERLMPLGAHFSFSGDFLHPRKAKLRELFRQLPRERILLETDAPGMLPPGEVVSHPLPGGLNHPANLPAIGHGLAQLLGLEVEALRALLSENSRRLFGILDHPTP